MPAKLVAAYEKAGPSTRRPSYHSCVISYANVHAASKIGMQPTAPSAGSLTNGRPMMKASIKERKRHKKDEQ